MAPEHLDSKHIASVYNSYSLAAIIDLCRGSDRLLIPLHHPLCRRRSIEVLVCMMRIVTRVEASAAEGVTLVAVVDVSVSEGVTTVVVDARSDLPAGQSNCSQSVMQGMNTWTYRWLITRARAVAPGLKWSTREVAPDDCCDDCFR